MLTAYGPAERVSRAVEAGVFGYLVKPFRESDLLPAIETAPRPVRGAWRRCARRPSPWRRHSLRARRSSARKGLLMERDGLSEQEAFARLRRASQISGQPLRVVAEALIATLSK